MTLASLCVVCGTHIDATECAPADELSPRCELHADADLSTLNSAERRTVRVDRRKGERRQFPPRPEGRRHDDGRRSDDASTR